MSGFNLRDLVDQAMRCPMCQRPLGTRCGCQVPDEVRQSAAVGAVLAALTAADRGERFMVPVARIHKVLGFAGNHDEVPLGVFYLALEQEPTEADLEWGRQVAATLPADPPPDPAED